MKYIITGCDGQLGGRVAANMLEAVSGDQLIFTCPNVGRLPAEKVKEWQERGVSIRQARYDHTGEMLRAFEGGERIYVVSGILNGPERVVQHKKVFDACAESQVRHIIYTSFFGANRPEYLQYVLPDHTATEAYLREMAHRLGFTYNIMRNNLYMENYLTNSILLANLSNYIWGTTAGEGKFTPIAKDDSAACAAALLLGKGAANMDYDLTSETPISQREICEMVAERSGRPYTYTAMNDREFYAYLDKLGIPRADVGANPEAPVPWCGNDMVTNEGGIAEGQMGVVSHDVRRLLERKPLEIADLLDRYSYMWEENVSSYRRIR